MHVSLVHDILLCYPYTYILPLLPLCAVFLVVSKRQKVSRLPLPPSPPSEPIIGHVRLMPTSFQWRTFSDWGKTLGDFIFISIVGKPTIILNSAEAARDLLDKRAENYSDRPRLVLHGEILGTDKMLPLLGYGERWRAQRRLMQQYFNSRAVASFHPLQRAQIGIFLKNLLASPENFINHAHRTSTAALLLATYGHEVTSDDDSIVQIAVESTSRFVEAGTPGATMVDFFPILRFVPSWFPGASFQKKAAYARKALEDLQDVPYDEVKSRRATGEAVPSFMSQMIDVYESKHRGDDDFEINMKNVAAVIYGAGVETSAIVLSTFLLMMTCHPEVVARAHAEIDSVVGDERLPTLDDRASLPYVECILKEVYRMNPPLPLGISHQSVSEDTYRQNRIPSGSMIIPNIWSMMRDERYFPQPEHFNPGRFLSKVMSSRELGNDTGRVARGLVGMSLDDPSSLVFGFGRRACPGRFFADASAWLTIANVLAAFDILAPVDPATGVELKPVVEYTPGLSSKPRPFKCNILPRSARYITLINEDPSDI